MSQYKKGKTDMDFTEARDSEQQWHQLGHSKSAHRSRQISMAAPHRSFYRPDALPSTQPTSSVKTLKTEKTTGCFGDLAYLLRSGINVIAISSTHHPAYVISIPATKQHYSCVDTKLEHLVKGTDAQDLLTTTSS